jgi:hypothetical protein
MRQLPAVCNRDGVPDVPAPVMIPLTETRALTDAERALLGALVARTGNADLRAQARSAVVESVCSCGCPSVGLRSDGPALSTAEMLAFSGHGRDDVFGVHGYRDKVVVVVHVLLGRLAELEVYAGDGVATPLPFPEDLTTIEIY